MANPLSFTALRSQRQGVVRSKTAAFHLPRACLERQSWFGTQILPGGPPRGLQRPFRDRLWRLSDDLLLTLDRHFLSSRSSVLLWF